MHTQLPKVLQRAIARTSTATARRAVHSGIRAATPVLSTTATAVVTPRTSSSLHQAAPINVSGVRFSSSDVGAISRDSLRSSETFSGGLKTILALLSERGSWNYAEAWVPHEGNDYLSCKATWADDSFDAVESFREAANNINLNKGKGEVGRVWEKGTPSFLPELKFKGRARINGAEGAGLTTGLVVPVLQGNDVMAVLHFYSTKSVDSSSSEAMMQDFTRHGSMLMAAHLDHLFVH